MTRAGTLARRREGRPPLDHLVRRVALSLEAELMQNTPRHQSPCAVSGPWNATRLGE